MRRQADENIVENSLGCAMRAPKAQLCGSALKAGSVAQSRVWKPTLSKSGSVLLLQVYFRSECFIWVCLCQKVKWPQFSSDPAPVLYKSQCHEERDRLLWCRRTWQKPKKGVSRKLSSLYVTRIRDWDNCHPAFEPGKLKYRFTRTSGSWRRPIWRHPTGILLLRMLSIDFNGITYSITLFVIKCSRPVASQCRECKCNFGRNCKWLTPDWPWPRVCRPARGTGQYTTVPGSKLQISMCLSSQPCFLPLWW